MSTQPDSTPAASAEAPDNGVGCDALFGKPILVKSYQTPEHLKWAAYGVQEFLSWPHRRFKDKDGCTPMMKNECGPACWWGLFPKVTHSVMVYETPENFVVWVEPNIAGLPRAENAATPTPSTQSNP